MEITLRKAFESTFHDKQSFDHFLLCDSSQSIQLFSSPKHPNAYYQPEQTLKSYLKFLNRFVFCYASVQQDVVFSYRKNHSVLQALLQHQGNHCFFKTDLKNFFNSITVSDVQNVIQTTLSKSPISDLANYTALLEGMVTKDGILPVGFPTSPAISNGVLYSIDEELAKWTLKNEVVYTRYSDDLIFSAQNNDSLKALPAIIEGLLIKYFGGRLELNPSKTYFTHSGRKLKLLGLVMLPNGQVTVSKTIKSKIETLMHYYEYDRLVFEQLLVKNFGNLSRFFGVLNYVSTVDKYYIDKLRGKYGNYLIDLFMKGKITQ